MTNIKTYEEFAALGEQEKKEAFEEILRDCKYYFSWWQEGRENLKEVIGQRDAEIAHVSTLKQGISMKLQEILDEHNAIVKTKQAWLNTFIRCCTIDELNVAKTQMLSYELENYDDGSFSYGLEDDIMAIIEDGKSNGEEGTDTSAD